LDALGINLGFLACIHNQLFNSGGGAQEVGLYPDPGLRWKDVASQLLVGLKMLVWHPRRVKTPRKRLRRSSTDAQAKGGQIVREANERAEAVAREVKGRGGRGSSPRDEKLAVAEVQQERERILSDLRGQVAALAMAVAQKLIGETLDEKRQHATYR
jgi:hypothetical protein